MTKKLSNNNGLQKLRIYDKFRCDKVRIEKSWRKGCWRHPPTKDNKNLR